MTHRFQHDSAEELLGCEYRLALARNLGRTYTDVLEAPIPADLKRLVAQLELRERSRPAEFKRGSVQVGQRRRQPK
jgi:hypothetical protein